MSGVNDHTALDDVISNNNTCGYKFREYTCTMGNQVIENGSMAGNFLGSFCVATTNQMDSSLLKNVHTGVVDGNTIINGGGVTGNHTYAIADGKGGYLQPAGIVDVASFNGNHMYATNWNSYNSITDAAVIAATNCDGNNWQDDAGFVFYSLPTVVQLDCGGQGGNTFNGSFGSGVIRVALYDDVKQFNALSEYGYSGVGLFHPGNGFAGLAATAVSPGPHRTLAVLKSAPTIPPIGINAAQGVPKTDSTQLIANTQPVFAEAGGTVSGGLSQSHAIGVAIVDGPTGAGMVSIALDPGLSGGAPGTLTGLTADGTALKAQVSEFSVVASGVTAMLGIIPVGDAETMRL